MQLFAFGVNHNTAPLAVREQVTFHAANLEDALRDLVNHEQVREAAIISTCNRTEVYVTDPQHVDDPRPIVVLLSEIKGEPPIEGVPFTALTGEIGRAHV